MKNINKKISGFTLIELVIVLVILGILSAIVVPRLISAEKSADDVYYKTALKTANSTHGLYLLQNRTLPTLAQFKDAMQETAGSKATVDLNTDNDGLLITPSSIQPFTISTFKDSNCSEKTTADSDTVKCVGSTTIASGNIQGQSEGNAPPEEPQPAPIDTVAEMNTTIQNTPIPPNTNLLQYRSLVRDMFEYGGSYGYVKLPGNGDITYEVDTYNDGIKLTASDNSHGYQIPTYQDEACTVRLPNTYTRAWTIVKCAGPIRSWGTTP